MRPLVEAFRPLYPVFGLFVISTAWMLFSPNEMMAYDPRMFIMVTGTIFSNISVRKSFDDLMPEQHKIY